MKKKFWIGLFLLFALFTACEKEVEYLYEVNPVTVSSAGSGKSNAKSTTEFLTIAWADLFGTQIPQQELIQLNTVYQAFGDKKLIEDRILLNFLTRPGVQIPALPHVNGDTLQFIVSTYKKLYNRSPDAFEQYYMKEQIRLNAAMSPRVIWYALMTADEYRYY
ncbi:MAG: hypothetical protein JNM19_11965 [Chitinophagaceae bacterium]|nr:hypothetical protein [Chitinophagaceae bacterium]